MTTQKLTMAGERTRKWKPETRANKLFEKIKNESYAFLEQLRRQIALEQEMRIKYPAPAKSGKPLIEVLTKSE